MAYNTKFTFMGTGGVDDTRPLAKVLVGNDIVEGDGGDDFLWAYDGMDFVKGEEGADDLNGGAGDDSLFGGIDNDRIRGGANNDYAEGGFGHDILKGDGGHDILWGDNAATLIPKIDPANDLIRGPADPLLDGDDDIFGGGGNDTLNGENGNDTLSGGRGNDVLTGGPGRDVFVFTPQDSLIGKEIDTITDFDVNEDSIHLGAFNLNINEGDQFAFDEFSNGMTQGLQSAFYQMGANVIIGSRPQLGYNLGSLGDANLNESQIVIVGVNIEDLGGGSFIFE